MKIMKTLLIVSACILFLGSSDKGQEEKECRQNGRIPIGNVCHLEKMVLETIYGQARLVHRMCEIKGLEPGKRFDLGGIDFPCREPTVWFVNYPVMDRDSFYDRLKSGEYNKALKANNEKYGWNK